MGRSVERTLAALASQTGIVPLAAASLESAPRQLWEIAAVSLIK
jgi:hypothetical protein